MTESQYRAANARVFSVMVVILGYFTISGRFVRYPMGAAMKKH